MAAKIPIAQKRLFGGVFICKECSHKIRTQAVRVMARKVRCPKCKSTAFRAMRKK
jgi:Zn finger protein HypA/HybF involved in hydrogenase expression